MPDVCPVIPLSFYDDIAKKSMDSQSSDVPAPFAAQKARRVG